MYSITENFKTFWKGIQSLICSTVVQYNFWFIWSVPRPIYSKYLINTTLSLCKHRTISYFPNFLSQKHAFRIIQTCKYWWKLICEKNFQQLSVVGHFWDEGCLFTIRKYNVCKYKIYSFTIFVSHTWWIVHKLLNINSITQITIFTLRDIIYDHITSTVTQQKYYWKKYSES